MSPRLLTVAEVGEALVRLESKVDALLASRRSPPRALLSLSQAAAALGVSRNGALHEMLATGRIRAVRVRGRTRIPASEVERVQREGA